MYDRLVHDDEYTQLVRRYRPSSLLLAVAAAGAHYGVPQAQPRWLAGGVHTKFTPWALADVARVSLARGTEFHRAEAIDKDLLKILAAYSSLKDPTLHDVGDGAVRLRDFMLRTTGQQQAFQGARSFMTLLGLHPYMPPLRFQRVGRPTTWCPDGRAGSLAAL